MADSLDGDPEPTSSEPPSSLRRTTVRGAQLAFAGYVLSQGIMFGIFVVLARLVTPRDFGRYAAASVVVGVGTLFAESGMMSALIQREGRMDEAASTAFFSLLIGGTLLSLAALASAPLLGVIFAGDHITGLAAALSAGMLLRALTVVPDALLQRRFSFARRVAVDPLGSAAFAVASIIPAAYGAGAWALIAGSYASLIAQVISSWGFARFRPRRKLASIAMWRELASFARHVLGSEVLNRVASQLDAVMLGRFAGAAPLGQYRNGLRLAQQPFEALVSVGAYVLLPALARMAGERERLAAAARGVLRIVTAVMLPISVSLLVLGEPAAVLLLGHHWRQAGHVIAALCGLIWAGSMISVCSEVFKAVGRPQNLVRMWFVSLCSLAVLVTVTAITLGPVGVGAAVSATQLLTAAYALSMAAPLIDLSWRQLAADIAAPAAASTIAVLAMLAFNVGLDPLGHAALGKWALTVAEVLLGAGAYGAVLLALDRSRRGATRDYLVRLRARRSSAMEAG